MSDNHDHEYEQPERGVGAGQVAVERFGERSLTRMAETSSTALAEQAKAAVQARYIMAMQRPRDLLRARQALLADCKRPGFAERAIYNKPVGKGVEGPSIRLAEAAARAMGNIYADVAAIYDDESKRIVRVSATDLETNVCYPMDVTIAKTIERSKPQPGRKVVSLRKNSQGRDVFVIEATDEEILDKERALASKALRTCLLRLIPADLLEEAIEQSYATRRGEIKKDPSAARKKMVDAFESMGVTAAQIADYLGHAIDTASTEEIDRMRSLWQAIRDGEATWADAIEQVRRERGPTAEEAASQAAKPLDARLKEKAARTAPAAAATPVEADERAPWDGDAEPAASAPAAQPAEGEADPLAIEAFGLPDVPYADLAAGWESTKVGGNGPLAAKTWQEIVDSPRGGWEHKALVGLVREAQQRIAKGGPASSTAKKAQATLDKARERHGITA